MDNALQVFNYNSHEVRTVEKNGDIWFVAKDVCDVLEHSNSRMAVQNLDDDEKDVSKVYTPSGEQDMTIISESGVYALVLRSNKPEAKEFSRWVRKEVLPQIRKTGQFSIKKELAALPAGVIDGAKTILEVAGIKDNQLALALDKLFRSYTGKSALDTCGVNLIAPVKEQCLTVSEITRHFDFDKPKKGAQFINSLLEQSGYQFRTPNKLWEPTELGKQFAVMLDANKKHSDGSPVRFLKWNTGIINVIQNLLH